MKSFSSSSKLTGFSGTWSALTLLALLLLPLNAASSSQDDNKLVLDGSTTVGPIAKAFAEHYMNLHQDVSITVSESGSGNGAKGLINGTCDVANMSRFMKEKEFTAAVEAGVSPVAHVVALDGIAMAVHPSNPITKLSVEQVRDIYLGKITTWSDLGGPNRPIVIISRDTNSGTYETFEKMVMNKQKMASSVEYLGSNGAVKQKIQTTPSAIGYIGLGFLDRQIKPLLINDVEPTAATVANGSYPIARPLYMFTNGFPRLGTLTHAFVTLHLSRQGQEIVEAIGFVPVTAY